MLAAVKLEELVDSLDGAGIAAADHDLRADPYRIADDWCRAQSGILPGTLREV